MIHLDTNFLIQALVAGSPAETNLQTWLTAGEDLGISTIAWSEFLCGPLTPKDEGHLPLRIGWGEGWGEVICTISTPPGYAHGPWPTAISPQWLSAAVPALRPATRRISSPFKNTA